MKRFEWNEPQEAKDYAAAGGQALHVCPGEFITNRPGTPRPCRKASEFAHLFDQDRTRLVETARRLGVVVIVVDRDGTPGQHVDLVGKPLARAKEEAESPRLL